MGRVNVCTMLVYAAQEVSTSKSTIKDDLSILAPGFPSNELVFIREVKTKSLDGKSIYNLA